MKNLLKIALAAVLLTTAAVAQAQWSSYRYSTTTIYTQPSCGFSSFSSPSYSGYSGFSGYSSPVTVSGSSTRFGNSVYHNYRSSGGGTLSGTATYFGNGAYTTLRGW
ncbi:MAG: hypothetical protein HZA90_20400 [Verrucomicrobia bacterium]|nr:hypothetical protein [Verrucomicrobiota bacterium]